MNKRSAIRGVALVTALLLMTLALPLVPVAAKPVLKEDGWYYADKLPSGITAAKYTIQYCSYYDQVATKSPGKDWVKGALTKTASKNKGDPYWSTMELAVSETRTLVDTYYYHYCGQYGQGHANYYATSTFYHYDTVDKSSYTPDSGHPDNEDPRYRYYTLKSSKGNTVYCQHGKTCKSNTDVHSKRCCYWYRASQYQDKTVTKYYTYTKTSGWLSAAETGADRVEVRYKAKVSTSTANATTTTT